MVSISFGTFSCTWDDLTWLLCFFLKYVWNHKLGIGSPEIGSGPWWMPARQHLNPCLPLWWLRTDFSHLVATCFATFFYHQWELFLLQAFTVFKILPTRIYTSLAVKKPLRGFGFVFFWWNSRVQWPNNPQCQELNIATLKKKKLVWIIKRFIL